MSSFKSSNSSFDPLDYYKKLTMCLANKKNCKINISRVPGGKELVENKRLPNRITEEHLQLKFLAKYNEKKALELQQKEQEQAAAQKKALKKNPFNFDFKQNALMKDNNNGKRKKEDEAYLNLPPSYFHSTNVPDLAIFKVPTVPEVPEIPPKKPRLQIPDNSSNFTLESLFSGNFKPPRTSTPIEPQQPVERPQPIISDPCEILGMMKKRVEAKKTQNDPKMKAFVALIDTTAKKIDSTCFADIEDQAQEILKRLNVTHEIASQSPRQSLLGSAISTIIPSRPVPIFYDHEEKKHENAPRIDTIGLESFFNKSGFSIDNTSPAMNFDEMFASPSFSMNDFDISTATNDFLFDASTSYQNYCNDSMLMTPQRDRIDDAMDFNWLEDVFTSLDLEYIDKPVKSQTNRRTSIDIFRSPPSRLSLQRKFAEARFQRDSFEDLSTTTADDDKNNNSLWTNQTLFTVNNNDSVFDTSFDLF